MNFQCRKVV